MLGLIETSTRQGCEKGAKSSAAGSNAVGRKDRQKTCSSYGLWL